MYIHVFSCFGRRYICSLGLYALDVTQQCHPLPWHKIMTFSGDKNSLLLCQNIDSLLWSNMCVCECVCVYVCEYVCEYECEGVCE